MKARDSFYSPDYTLGFPIYILPGLLIGLGIIIGFAALKAHLRVTVLTKQKDLFY
jgi:hypothetical protein